MWAIEFQNLGLFDEMSCVRFRVHLTGADFASAPPASASSVGEVDFRSLVNKHTVRPSSSSGSSSSRPAKRVKTTLVSSNLGEAAVASSSSSSSVSAAGGPNERATISSSGALDLSAYDNMSLDSVIGSGHRHGGGLTSVIEKIERSYANPLYFMPSSSEEEDSMESNNSDDNDVEGDDVDDDDDDINLENSEGNRTGDGLSNILKTSTKLWQLLAMQIKVGKMWGSIQRKRMVRRKSERNCVRCGV